MFPSVAVISPFLCESLGVAATTGSRRFDDGLGWLLFLAGIGRWGWLFKYKAEKPAGHTGDGGEDLRQGEPERAKNEANANAAAGKAAGGIIAVWAEEKRDAAE